MGSRLLRTRTRPRLLPLLPSHHFRLQVSPAFSFTPTSTSTSTFSSFPGNSSSCSCITTTTTTTTTSASSPSTPAINPRTPAIDRTSPLRNTMAPYRQHLLVCTGQRDWKSRIEEDGLGTGWGDLARGVRALMRGRGGGGASGGAGGAGDRGEDGIIVDPYNNILITYSSFPPHSSPPPPPSSPIHQPPTTPTSTTTASALLLPSFTYLPHLPTSPPSIRSFIRAFLLPKAPELDPLHAHVAASTRRQMSRDEDSSLRESFAPRPIDHPVILICGHGGRDERCGVMGPVLEGEFRRVLERRRVDVLRLEEGAVRVGLDLDSGSGSGSDSRGSGGHGAKASVGLISHIGGHKFAGNVIVYIPPGFKIVGDGGGERESGLAGKGVWYGRVEARHVEAIVEETVCKGRIVEELFRGGVGADGRVLRID